MADQYSVLVIDGTLQEYMESDLLPAVPFDGLSREEAAQLCSFAFRRGFTCVVQQSGGEDDAEAESRKEL